MYAKFVSVMTGLSILSSGATTLASYDFESTTSPFASTVNVVSASSVLGGATQQNSLGGSNFYNGTQGGVTGSVVANGGTSSLWFTTGPVGGGDITYETFSATYWDPNNRGWTGTLTWSDSSGILGSSALTIDGATDEIDFADFTSSETITWTIAGVNPGSSDRLRMDDLVLTGTINTVPEPTSLGLISLGAFVGILRRSRSLR